MYDMHVMVIIVKVSRSSVCDCLVGQCHCIANWQERDQLCSVHVIERRSFDRSYVLLIRSGRSMLGKVYRSIYIVPITSRGTRLTSDLHPYSAANFSTACSVSGAKSQNQLITNWSRDVRVCLLDAFVVDNCRFETGIYRRKGQL